MQRIATQTTDSYPDVLGTLSDTRLNTDVIQAALGIFPRAAAVGQPFELLVILQNRVDQPVPVTLTLTLPRKDPAGNRINMSTPRESIPMTVPAGEVGLAHIPVVALPPTPPGAGYALRVSVETRRPRNAKFIREVLGGRAAGNLPMSPHRLAILQYEVNFGAIGPGAGTRLLNTLNGTFDILAGQVPSSGNTAPRYETLWDARTLPDDQKKYGVLEARTRQLTQTLTRARLYEPLIDETDRRFKAAGFPLLAGEVIAIAKLLTYTMEDGLEIEEGFRVSDSRWFQRLVAHIDDPAIQSDDAQLIMPLYAPVMHDATRLGFHMLARSVKEPLGSAAEHILQANRLIEALEQGGAIQLQHVYVPLILAGLMLLAQIKATDEDLWATLDEVRVAWRTRAMAGAPAIPLVNKLIDELLSREEEFLIRMKVPRH